MGDNRLETAVDNYNNARIALIRVAAGIVEEVLTGLGYTKAVNESRKGWVKNGFWIILIPGNRQFLLELLPDPKGLPNQQHAVQTWLPVLTTHLARKFTVEYVERGAPHSHGPYLVMTIR